MQKKKNLSVENGNFIVDKNSPASNDMKKKTSFDFLVFKNRLAIQICKTERIGVSEGGTRCRKIGSTKKKKVEKE